MILSTIVHGLEVVTALLFVLLGVQVFRCYRNFNSASLAPANPQAEFAKEDDEVEITVAAAQASAFTAKSVPSEASPGRESVERDSAELDSEAPTSASKAILNDYIGEFFSESVATDLQAYKQTADESQIAESEDVPVVREISAEELAEYKVPAEATAKLKEAANDIEEGAVKSLEPVLLNQVQVVESEEEDDAFIVVESEDATELNAARDVMSDKVVHAMLKEAKLAYPS